MIRPLALLATLLIAQAPAGAAASADTAILPPDAAVARVLQAQPAIQAAVSQIRAEEAARRRLEAGPYEWALRLGGQQRLTRLPATPEERFTEWNAALERPLRLPGKAAADAETGAAGVALAEIAHQDMRHETSRVLLAGWFTWLRARAGAEQWAAQVALLERQAAAVSRRQQLGDAARIETVQAEAALAQARAQGGQARSRAGVAAEDLRRRFPGLPVDAPARVPEPAPVLGSEDDWIARQLAHNHELGVARNETRRQHALASRAGHERSPDPSVGVQVARERGGEDRLVGAFVSIPLPGAARAASADAALAQADAAHRREAAVLQRITAEAAALYRNAVAAVDAWRSLHDAALRLDSAATLTARAYQLGEGSLNDVLLTRRQAHEATLAATTAQLDALELGYRLQLDAHALWDLDEE